MAREAVNIEFEPPETAHHCRKTWCMDTKLKATVYNPYGTSNAGCHCSPEKTNPKSWFAAGWYRVKQHRKWKMVQHPKLITLERYDYQGPFQTKKKQMSNPFRDQEKFMRACDQSVGEFNEAQYQLYCNLISEEFNELIASKTKVDDLDALIDILVVTIGAIHSLGADAEGAWKEVMAPTLPRSTRKQARFASVKMARY
jgi:predicted HAD superfamily Cof-like phosphohydrolase